MGVKNYCELGAKKVMPLCTFFLPFVSTLGLDEEVVLREEVGHVEEERSNCWESPAEIFASIGNSCTRYELPQVGCHV